MSFGEFGEGVEGIMGMREGPAPAPMTAESEGKDEEAVEQEKVVLTDREVELSDGDREVEESEEFDGFSDTPGATPVAVAGATTTPALDDDAWDRLMDPNSTDFVDFDERIGGSDDEEEDSEDEDGHLDLARTDDEWSGSEDEGEDEKPAPKKVLAVAPTKEKKATATGDKKTKADAEPVSAKEKKTKAKAAPMPAASSKFLPSLMSGYVSGSDSDPDADYYKDKKPGPPEKKERKNRMGQQARRALWEKKFGKEANHVKSAEEEAREKRERRDAKRARNGLAPMGEKRPEKEGPLHPSWEAARLAKEKQAKMAEVMFKPQGKKITFD